MLARREQLIVPIAELEAYGLSTKVIDVLEGLLDGENRIVTVGHLSELNDEQLLAVPNFGKGKLNELREALRSFLKDRKGSRLREEKRKANND